MRDAVQGLIGTILDGIGKDESCASQLADIAHRSKENGEPLVAQGLLALSRHHQVNAIVGRSQLAVLSIEYTSMFYDITAEKPSET